jgi:hypothetical protein
MLTPEYFERKLTLKYGQHPNVDEIELRRVSRIVDKLDYSLEGLSFSLNQNYILVERKQFEGDLRICSFDFTNQDPRLFLNLNADNCRPYDALRQLQELNYQNFGGGRFPYYRFDNRNIHPDPLERDEYFIQIIGKVYDHLINSAR